MKYAMSQRVVARTSHRFSWASTLPVQVFQQQTPTTKIRRDIWNADDPSIHRVAPPVHSARRKQDHTIQARPNDACPCSCKTKVWRFQPGGPRRCCKGLSMNSITLEQPCLQNTCSNCRVHDSGILDG